MEDGGLQIPRGWFLQGPEAPSSKTESQHSILPVTGHSYPNQTYTERKRGVKGLKELIFILLLKQGLNESHFGHTAENKCRLNESSSVKSQII